MGTMTEKTENFNYRNSLKRGTADFIIDKIKYVDLYLNRPVAGLMVKILYPTSITPNAVTYVAFLIGIAGAVCYTFGTYTAFILGGILAQLSSVIDGADGMLARSKNMCSRYGAFLDLFFDRINDFFMFVGIALGVSKYLRDDFFLFLGLLAAGLYLLQINLFYLTKSYLEVEKTGDTGEARALLIWVLLIFSILNRLDLFIFLLLGETLLVNLVRLISFMRLKRD